MQMSCLCVSVEWGSGIEWGWRARLGFLVAERPVPSSDNFFSNMTSGSNAIGASNETINLAGVSAHGDWGDYLGAIFSSFFVAVFKCLILLDFFNFASLTFMFFLNAHTFPPVFLSSFHLHLFHWLWGALYYALDSKLNVLVYDGRRHINWKRTHINCKTREASATEINSNSARTVKVLFEMQAPRQMD